MAIDPTTLAKTVHQIYQRLKSLTKKDTYTFLTLTVVTLLALVLLVLTSPFGIYFALHEDNGSDKSIAAIMRELESELLAKVETLQNQPSDHDELFIIYEGSETNRPIINTQDVIAVFAVSEGMDTSDPNTVAVLTDRQIAKLREIFWRMNDVSVEYRDIELNPDGSLIYEGAPLPEDVFATPSPPPTVTPTPTPSLTSTLPPGQTPPPAPEPTPEPTPLIKRTKVIIVSSLSYTEVAHDFHFTGEQIFMLETLMDPYYASLFIGMVGVGTGVATGGDDRLADLGGMTPDELEAIRASLPSNLTHAQESAATAALSLVGRVSYFWAGKSTTIGWDDRWGEPRTVTGEGSKTTGTVRPFGLDCSGYVAWVFAQIGIPTDKISSTIGTSTRTQWNKSQPIEISKLRVGDLVFQAIPGTVATNHVGICVGFEGDGSPKIAHCSSSKNGVVVSGLGKTFKFARRPAVFCDAP